VLGWACPWCEVGSGSDHFLGFRCRCSLSVACSSVEYCDNEDEELEADDAIVVAGRLMGIDDGDSFRLGDGLDFEGFGEDGGLESVSGEESENGN